MRTGQTLAATALATGSALSDGLRRPRRTRSQNSASGAENEQTGAMASKYDQYWAAHLDEISAALQAAVNGTAATIDVASVRRLGDRQSWYGIAEVCGREMTRSSMAHATSLGRTVAASGICAAWPKRTFRFTIGATGALTITIADQLPRPRQAAAGGITDASGGRAAEPIAETESREHSPGADSSADSRAADTNRFYLLLSELARRVGRLRMLQDCTARRTGHVTACTSSSRTVSSAPTAAAEWSASALTR